MIGFCHNFFLILLIVRFQNYVQCIVGYEEKVFTHGNIENKYAWLAHISCASKDDIIFTRKYCLGALIGDNRVVTSKKCIMNDDTSTTMDYCEVEFLENGQSASNDRYTQVRSISTVYFSENLITYPKAADVLVIKLDRKVDNVASIEMIKGKDIDMSKCVTFGTPALKPEGRIKYISIPHLNEEFCKTAHNLPSLDNALCMGYDNEGTGLNKYDEGAPLACLKDNEFYLHGVASLNTEDGCGNKPSVFLKTRERFFNDDKSVSHYQTIKLEAINLLYEKLSPNSKVVENS